MSDYEKAVVAANDARSGRVIPAWRTWVMIAIMAVSLIAAYRIGMADVGNGWVILVAFILGVLHETIYGTYRKRSIR